MAYLRKRKDHPKTDNYGTKVYYFIDKKWEQEKASFKPLLLLLLLIFALFMIFNVLRGFIFPGSADIEVLEKERVKFTEEYRGLIIRDENIRYAPGSGNVHKVIEEGERAARKQPVVSYKDLEQKAGESEDELEVKLEKIDLKIDEVRKKEAEVREIQENIRKVFATKQADKDLSSFEVNSREREDGFNGGEVVRSLNPGIVSYRYDGYENVLSPEGIQGLSGNKIEGFITADHKDLNSLEDRELVIRGEPLFKTVDNYSWLISIVIKESTLKDLVGFQNYIELSPASEENWYRAGIKEYEKDGAKSTLFMEMNEEIDEFWNKRTIDISIITDTKEGFGIPGKSLVEMNGDKGVYIVKKGIVRFNPVEILFRKDGKIYVDGLEEGEKIVISPRFIEEGDKIR